MSVIAGDKAAFDLGPDEPDRPVGLGPGIRLVRVQAPQRMEAATRLVGDQSEDPYSAAQRFLESAADMRLDLDLMWATVGGNGSGEIRQVALAVPGSGRTVMMFVSGPARRRRGGAATLVELGSGPPAVRERVAVIHAACAHVSRPGEGRIASVLAQALLEQREKEGIAAFVAAGFTRLGDLAYMRRIGAAPAAPTLPLPAGVELVSVRALTDTTAAPDVDARLVDTLERTYIQTQDCPELCGLRSAADVLESHRLVGRFDPSLWWLVRVDGRDAGCMLFNVCPEHDSAELVYLGLAPEARGKGLGRGLMVRGLRHILGAEAIGTDQPRPRNLVGAGGVTCAVDTRNAPAMRLYRALGFQRFGVRVPVVLGLTDQADR